VKPSGALKTQKGGDLHGDVSVAIRHEKNLWKAGTWERRDYDRVNLLHRIMIYVDRANARIEHLLRDVGGGFLTDRKRSGSPCKNTFDFLARNVVALEIL